MAQCIVVIVGPTARCKSELAVELAGRPGGMRIRCQDYFRWAAGEAAVVAGDGEVDDADSPVLVGRAVDGRFWWRGQRGAVNRGAEWGVGGAVCPATVVAGL